MTIAQNVVELANLFGVDVSDYKDGNIAGLINTITVKKDGQIANNQNIQLAIKNLAKALGKEEIPLSKNIVVAIAQLKKEVSHKPVKMVEKDKQIENKTETRKAVKVSTKTENKETPDKTETSETKW